MGVSIYFQAVIPIDGDTYRINDAVRQACKLAQVELPAQISAFFGDEDDDEREVTPDGIRVFLYGAPVVQGDVMYEEGALIDLSLIPPGTTHIRVYSSC